MSSNSTKSKKDKKHRGVDNQNKSKDSKSTRSKKNTPLFEQIESIIREETSKQYKCNEKNEFQQLLQRKVIVVVILHQI